MNLRHTSTCLRFQAIVFLDGKLWVFSPGHPKNKKEACRRPSQACLLRSLQSPQFASGKHKTEPQGLVVGGVAENPILLCLSMTFRCVYTWPGQKEGAQDPSVATLPPASPQVSRAWSGWVNWDNQASPPASISSALKWWSAALLWGGFGN